MSIFDWLLVGHLVGDWLLQSNWMAKGKKQALFTWPGFIHFAIYTVVIMVLLWLARGKAVEPTTYLQIGVIIFVSHWLVDATGAVEWWMSVYKQSREFVRILIDQTLHLLILALVTTLLLVG